MSSLFSLNCNLSKGTQICKTSIAFQIKQRNGKLLSTSNHISSSLSFSSSSSPFTVNTPSSSKSSSWERGAKLVKNTDTTNKYLEHIRETHDPAMQLKTMEDELRGTMGKALGKQGEKVISALRSVEEQRLKYEELIASCNKDNLDANANDGDGLNEQDEGYDMRPNIGRISFQSLSESRQIEMVQIILSYNKYIKDAEKARWELTVHRQAVGFIVNNHRFVQEKFPIPPQLSLPLDLDESLLLSLNDSVDNANGDSDVESKSIIHYQNMLKKISGKKKEVRKEPVVRNFGDQLDWWEKIGRWR